MKYKNLKIIGTNHIAKQSLDEVERTIENENPDIVAVELDKRRVVALLSDQKRKSKLSDIKLIGLKGYLFSLIGGYVQKKLGEKIGIMPGSEMLAAVKSAKRKKIRLELIDQDIIITLNRFSKNFGWKEIFKLCIFDVLRGLFFKKKVMKEWGLEEFNLLGVPDRLTIRKIMKMMKKRYPGIHKVLIEERNEVMASRLAKLIALNPDDSLLAIVGAGHEEDIIELIKKKKIDVVDYSYNFSYSYS